MTWLAGLGLTYWDWHIGNGLIGLLAGLIVPPALGRIRTVTGLARVQLAVVAGNGLGLCCGILIDGLVLARYGAAEALLGWYLPAVVTNVLFGLLLLPVVLYLAGRLAMTVETRTFLALTTLLVLTVIAATAAVAGGFSRLLSGLPLSASEGPSHDAAMLASLRWTGGLTLLVLLPALGVSLWLVRRITSPLADLTMSARSLEKGEYALPALVALEQREDELGELAAAFHRMSSSVQQRESALQQQISELRIEVDHEHESREVRTITESEYFRTLEQKARELRQRRAGFPNPRPVPPEAKS